MRSSATAARPPANTPLSCRPPLRMRQVLGFLSANCSLALLHAWSWVTHGVSMLPWWATALFSGHLHA